MIKNWGEGGDVTNKLHKRDFKLIKMKISGIA